MKCVFDLVLAAQQRGLVQCPCSVEVTRARAKQSHAVDMVPAGIERSVVSHVHRLELLHGFGEAARVHQLLRARDPVRCTRCRALLQLASGPLLPRLYGGCPRFECSVPRVVRALELDIDVGQDCKQCHTIAHAAFSTRQHGELFRGDLQLT